MCKQTITFNLEDFTEDGYLKYDGGYIGISEGSPLKGEDLVQLKWYAEPVIKPTLLSEALYLKESLTKLKESEHKECHCEHDMSDCVGCKHKDICF